MDFKQILNKVASTDFKLKLYMVDTLYIAILFKQLRSSVRQVVYIWDYLANSYYWFLFSVEEFIVMEIFFDIQFSTEIRFRCQIPPPPSKKFIFAKHRTFCRGVVLYIMKKCMKVCIQLNQISDIYLWVWSVGPN